MNSLNSYQIGDQMKHKYFNCQRCGREITHPNGIKKYCSDTCRNEILRKQRLEAVKRWNKRNPQKVKKSQRRYYEEHCLELCTKRKERYEQNKK